jgi:hypothetical protein
MKTHPRAKFHLISPSGYRETRVHGRTYALTHRRTHNDNLNIPAVATQTCRDNHSCACPIHPYPSRCVLLQPGRRQRRTSTWLVGPLCCCYRTSHRNQLRRSTETPSALLLLLLLLLLPLQPSQRLTIEAHPFQDPHTTCAYLMRQIDLFT